MEYYALISGLIVTANADGSIPLNSKIAAKAAVDQANAAPDLLAALEQIVAACTTGTRNADGEHIGVRMPSITDVNRARAAIAALQTPAKES